MERPDIVAWRWRFLREILDPNINLHDVVWLDETWVNAGHCLARCWTDDSKEGMAKTPVGKGGRLIVCHAGSSHGFVSGTADFHIENTGDYHEEMNGEHFQDWFENKLLATFEEPTIIVMDNAPYHSKILDPAPTTRHRKQEIMEWLRKHGETVNETMRKAELLEMVQLKKSVPVREIDNIAAKHGHRVIRLPPYHCHFNPIELIWANIKGFIARNNKTFTLTEVDRLLHEAISNISTDEWKKVVDHTAGILRKAWETDGLVEDAVEDMIISVSPEDDSSDEDVLDCESDDGW
uniref:Uncharacterized protein C21orf140 homolog n=2 Tax=Cacopsylla melanoneura TaxID=428564 RepID=A0A8D8Z6K1_9HEMI